VYLNINCQIKRTESIIVYYKPIQHIVIQGSFSRASYTLMYIEIQVIDH